MICIKENLYFDPTLGLILHVQAGQDETPVHIQLDAKLAGLFHLLLLRKGQLVPRQAFVDEVWEGNAWVGEKALTRNISRLRSVLKTYQLDRYCDIHTHPKKGYSMSIVSKPKQSPFIPNLNKPWNRSLWLGGILLLFLALMSSILLMEVENVEEQQLILQDTNGSTILEEILTHD